jgi:hypothetical protein
VRGITQEMKPANALKLVTTTTTKTTTTIIIIMTVIIIAAKEKFVHGTDWLTASFRQGTTQLANQIYRVNSD